jgi:hypothetical protein
VQNPWFSGSADLTLYRIEELLGTKLRALYQRRKGRDLYDLWLALTALPIRAERVVECFERYLEHGGVTISRADSRPICMTSSGLRRSAKISPPSYRPRRTTMLPRPQRRCTNG